MSTLNLPTEHGAYAFHTEIPVRVYELVGGLHVGNHTLVAYLNEAQMQFFKALGFSDLTVNGLIPVNRHLEISYLSEAHYGDVLEMHIAIAAFLDDEYEVIYRLVNPQTGRAICHARTLMLFYDYAARSRARVPDAFLAAYRQLRGHYEDTE